MSLILVILVAVSLSMDAFSLSLAYGTLGMKKTEINILSIIVGIYHFIMPLIGESVGSTIINILPITPNTLVFMVLFLIGFEMIIESFKDNNSISKLSIIGMLIFGFAVSIDSFTLGLGLNVLYKYKIVSALIFSLTSFIFTYIGLNIGKFINNKVGKISTLFGGLMLIILGIFYII
ncbi:MAG: manganese efflux pump [Bacilli bacterium]|nr:manganese efflux pump [Bacilli bacterium]